MIFARPAEPHDGRCQIGGCPTPEAQVTLIGFEGGSLITVVRVCHDHLRKLSTVTAAALGSLPSGRGHHNRAAVQRDADRRAHRRFIRRQQD